VVNAQRWRPLGPLSADSTHENGGFAPQIAVSPPQKPHPDQWTAHNATPSMVFRHVRRPAVRDHRGPVAPFVHHGGGAMPSFGSAGSCVGPRQLTRQTVSGSILSGAPDDEPDRPAPPFHSQAGLWGAKAGYQKRFQPEPFTETALSCRLPSRRQNRRMDPIPRPGRRPTRRRERTRTNWIQGSPTAVFCRVPITSFRNLGKAGLHVWGKETQTIACKEGFGSSDGKNGV
jgi:hypothetical protein